MRPEFILSLLTLCIFLGACIETETGAQAEAMLAEHRLLQAKMMQMQMAPSQQPTASTERHY